MFAFPNDARFRRLAAILADAVMKRVNVDGWSVGVEPCPLACLDFTKAGDLGDFGVDPGTNPDASQAAMAWGCTHDEAYNFILAYEQGAASFASDCFVQLALVYRARFLLLPRLRAAKL